MKYVSEMVTRIRQSGVSTVLATHPGPFLLQRERTAERGHPGLETLPMDADLLKRLLDAERDEASALRFHDLARPKMVVGRGEDADIQINHMSISKQHACIDATSAGGKVWDMGSRNGTFIDGTRLTPKRLYTLKSGAVVAFASIEYSFLLSKPFYKVVETLISKLET